MKRSPMKRTRSPRRVEHLDRMADLRPQVFARARDRCEADGWLPGRCAPGLNAHHRLPTGNGGPDTLENLVALCGSGTTGHHAYVHDHPTESYENGLLIRTSAGPPTERWVPPWLDDRAPRV